MQIGRAIRILREAKGIRLSELSDRAKLSKPFLSLVENGDREPSLSSIRSIAAALEVPADVFLTASQPGEGTMRSTDDSVAGLVGALEKMSVAESELRETLKQEAAR